MKYFLSLLFVIFFALSAQSSNIPKPIGYVNDFAHILKNDTKTKLNNVLIELKQKTGVEFAVVTIESTNGEDIFDYSMKLFQKWGIGQKGKDNGILFLVSVKDRKLRINTGYGVEGILPDGLLGRIRDRYVVPYFKKGVYDSGIFNGAMAIVNVVAKSENVKITGAVAPKKLKNKMSIIDIIIIIAALFVMIPYIFPFVAGFFLGSYKSGWESSLGGGFGGGGLGGGFGGFGGGSSGGGGVGGSW
jgi:uncharacterized protein